MADFRVGDRVRLLGRHPKEGWLGLQSYLDKEGVIQGVSFLHHGERYYNMSIEGVKYTLGVLHTMLGSATPLSPFEESVQQYIRSELKT